MKRTLSLALAVLCILMLAAPLTLSAAADETSLPGIGVTSYLGYHQNSSFESDGVYNTLDADGYHFATVYKASTGFFIKSDSYDLTQNASYTVSLDMALDIATNDYVYFGFGQLASPTNYYEPFSASKNFRYNDASNGLITNGYTVDSTENAKTVLTNIQGNKSFANYKFVVEENVLKSVIVTYDETSVTYTNASGVSALAGEFGMALRPGVSGNTPSAVLKNISVTVGEEVKYNVDFAARYQELCVAQAKFVQMSTDKTAVRVIAEVAVPDVDLDRFDCVGFEITKEGGNGAKTGSTQTLYKAVSTNTEPYTAADGSYLAAMVIKGLETTGTYSFTVRPFIQDTAGNTYWGEAKSFTVTDGVVAPDGNI